MNEINQFNLPEQLLDGEHNGQLPVKQLTSCS
jgi:hypothetical protein